MDFFVTLDTSELIEALTTLARTTDDAARGEVVLLPAEGAVLIELGGAGMTVPVQGWGGQVRVSSDWLLRMRKHLFTESADPVEYPGRFERRHVSGDNTLRWSLGRILRSCASRLTS